jgi:hypothetical protein
MKLCKSPILFCAFLFLAACASDPPVYKPVEVKVPVAVPCKAPQIEVPAWPLQKLDPAASLFEKVKAALVEIELRKGYEAQLSVAANACS